MEKFIIIKENNKRFKYELTQLELTDDFKELIFKEMKYAQDINSPFYLSNRYNYNEYHDVLKKYFIKKYNRSPSQTDNLAFIMLLSYPKAYVEKIKSFKEIKIAFNNR